MPPHPNAHLRHNNHPVAQSAPPPRRGELYPATVRSQFPSIGWVAGAGWFTRDSRVCRSGALRPMRILVFIRSALRLTSYTRIPSADACGYPRSCSNFALLVFTYSDLSRAKRGDPVNKKALRAFARRHYLHSILFTLHSILFPF